MIDSEYKTYVVHVGSVSSVALPSSSPLKEFAAVVLDSEHETYVVHVGLVSSEASPSSSPLEVHPSRRPQISGLIAEEAPTKVPAEYSDFATALPKHISVTFKVALISFIRKNDNSPPSQSVSSDRKRFAS